MGRRITRKQLKQDEFVSTVDTVVHWFIDNWRPVAAGLGAVTVVVLLWWVVASWSGSRADQASYLLYQAVTEYENQLGESSQATAAVEEKLREVMERYGRSDQADVARVYLARLLLERGEYGAARNLLVEVVDRHPTDAVGRIAAIDLMELRVTRGETAEVARELEAMVATPGPGLPQDTALFKLAELLVSQNDFDRAREYLQKLLTEFPESPYVAPARQRLGELG